ncbi:MAG: CaiB/BaiF CoA transferase family protein [bacterium]
MNATGTDSPSSDSLGDLPSQQNGPLCDLVVLDLTRVLAGPYATMVLADLGARVIKVEPPGGDDARRFGPFADGRSAYFESLNRGKESIALDLKAPADRAAFERLACTADVLVENYRAGAMERLGLGFDALHKLNPRLIYAAISGFGQTGPYRALPAYDLVVQAMGGLISVTGEDAARPARVGTSIGDIAAGLFGVNGILAALHQRARSGRGCLVDVGMLDCQVAILENAIGRYFAAGESPAPLGLRHPSITPFDGFQAADERLIIAAGNDALFAKLCAALGETSLPAREMFDSNDHRTRNHAALKRELERALARKSASEWLTILQAAGVPCAPINDIETVVADAHVNARNMIIETRNEDGARTKMAGNPIKISTCDDPPERRAAPRLDQDRERILASLEKGK